MRYFLEVSYKGTAYAGFQVQKNANTIRKGPFQILMESVDTIQTLSKACSHGYIQTSIFLQSNGQTMDALIPLQAEIWSP